MMKSARDCLAQAAACRATAASVSLENVRKVHLEAAASWEMLASRAERSEAPGRQDHSAYLVLGGRSAKASSSNDMPHNDHERPARKPLTIAAACEDDAEDDALPDSAEDIDSPAGTGETSDVRLFKPDGNLRPLRDIEADVIRIAICRHRGRMSEVARTLGIGRSTLYRKIDQLNIDISAKPAS